MNKPDYDARTCFLLQGGLPFADFKRLRVKGGSGGDGVVGFLRVFGNEFAGPDGGDGGNGGHVVMQGGFVHFTTEINSLGTIAAKKFNRVR